jgi:malate dehydrogenase (oxaloacetate-decarboxylating)
LETETQTEVAAVYLPHTGPLHPRRAQEARPGPLVVTDRDTTAISLAAALWTTLTARGRPLGDSRVVIAGAERAPMLAGLLVAAGVGELTAWPASDAAAYPLPRVAARADVVINLLGQVAAIRAVRTGHPEVVVITPVPWRDPLLALPGLLRAAVQVPGIELNVDVAQACVRALTMATPPLYPLPPRADRKLTEQLTEAVISTLPPAARHP